MDVDPKNYPKWFLVALLVLLLAVTPIALSYERRLILIEERQERTQEDSARFTRVLERLDQNIGKLSEAIVKLNIQVSHIESNKKK